MSDQWLVRTSKNILTGPFAKDVVTRRIQDGELDMQDEICSATGYWFYLHEEEELSRQLAIQLPPRPHAENKHDEEVTETQTQTQTDSQGIRPEPLPDVPEMSESLTENTAVLSNRALREFRSESKPATARSALSESRMYQPHVLGQVERNSLWRWTIWLLLLVIAGLFVWVIFLLKSQR